MLSVNVSSLCDCLVPCVSVVALEILAVVGVFLDAHLDLSTRLSWKIVLELEVSASSPVDCTVPCHGCHEEYSNSV